MLKRKGAFRRLVILYGLLFLGLLVVTTVYSFCRVSGRCRVEKT